MKSLSTTSLFSRDKYQNLFSREFYKRKSQKFFSLITIFNTFLLVALFATILFSSPQPSNAEDLATTVTASAGSSVYYASISNDDAVTIPVTPTSTQEEYTATNRILFSNTCPAGSSVQLNTSTSSNDLTRTGSDTGTKTISAVAGSGLTENTWGYKIEGSGSAFAQVPSVSATPAVLYTSSKAETNTPIDVVYGVKVDNNMPSGTYTNDVVYTVVVDNKCLQYTLSFVDEDGTTKLYDDINVNYGDTVDLTKYTPTKTGYTFAGWSNGSSIFSGNVDPNPSNDMTVKLSAVYTTQVYDFDYTGGVKPFTALVDGYYKLEVWGASGGGSVTGDCLYESAYPGMGGYSTGTIYLTKNTSIYVYVGGKGQRSSSSPTTVSGGWNGGGNAIKIQSSSYDIVSAGGGATDIAFKNTSNWNTSDHLYSRVIVAGGGGGGGMDGGISAICGKDYDRGTIPDGNERGGAGGGSNGYTYPTPNENGVSGTQTSGYAFGRGQDATTSYNTGYGQSGAGGGWYGGYVSTGAKWRGGGGGSGFIWTSSTKNNVPSGYSVSTDYYLINASTIAGNLTFKSPSGTNETGHYGNGFARITYLGTSI